MTFGKNLAPDSKRVIDRGRGCWNCKHFENGEVAKQHYRSCVTKDIMGLKKAGKYEVTRLGDGEPDIGRVQQLITQGYSQSRATDIASAEAERDAAMNRASMITDRQIQEESARFQYFDDQVNRGLVGMCRIGKNVGADGKVGEFVAQKYLCADGWTGVDGASLATEGKPMDVPTLELREEMDK